MLFCPISCEVTPKREFSFVDVEGKTVPEGFVQQEWSHGFWKIERQTFEIAADEQGHVIVPPHRIWISEARWLAHGIMAIPELFNLGPCGGPDLFKRESIEVFSVGYGDDRGVTYLEKPSGPLILKKRAKESEEDIWIRMRVGQLRTRQRSSVRSSP